MCFKKLFFAVVLSAGLFMTGCNKDKDNGGSTLSTGSVTDLDLAKIMNSPYSELTPEEQKAKLEQECIDFLDALNAATSLKALDVFDNFLNLLDRAEPDVDDPWTENESKGKVQWILDLTGVYGVFTWDRNKWNKTSSKSELKFIFPDKGTSGNNNASLSLKVVNSNYKIVDEWYDSYDKVTYEDIICVPSSATGILSLDNKEIAKIEAAAQYRKNPMELDGISVNPPESTQLKITTENNYVYWYSLSGSGKETKYEMQMSRDKKPLIETLFKVGIGLDTVFDGVEDIEDIEDIKKVFGKVGTMGFTKLMDNLVLVYQADDIPSFLIAVDKIDSERWRARENLNFYNNPNYYAQMEIIEKKYIDDLAKAMNDYVKSSLASTKEKDITKIAELVVKSEKVGEYYNGDYWNDYYWDWGYSYTKKYDEYGTKPYLKFGDGTLVEMEAYFSSGFDKLEKKWEDFIDAFNK